MSTGARQAGAAHNRPARSYCYQYGYWEGYRTGYDFGARWPTYSPEPHDVVDARIAAMEAAAEQQPGSTWRGAYPGGPVDWETGRLRESAGGTSPPAPDRRRLAAEALASTYAMIRDEAGAKPELLYWAAYRLGTLVGAGVVSEAVARADLNEAALKAGLPVRTIAPTILRGLRSGVTTVRQWWR